MKRTTVLSVAVALMMMTQGCAGSESGDMNGAAGTVALGTGGMAGTWSGFGGASGAGGIAPSGGVGGTIVAGGTTGGAPPPTGGAAGVAGMVPPPATGGVGGAPPMTGGAGGEGGVAGMVAMTGGTGGTPSVTGGDPIIPPLTATCPSFTDGTITFMGLGGIRVVAGAKAASATAPMVFYWHGTGSTSGEFASMAAAVRDGVVQEGGVLISFQGTTGGDGLSGTSIFGAGDFDLADQLLACAVQNHNVDPRRVFATGCSAGGLFSTNMAAQRSNYIAAVAPNSGGLTFPARWQSAYTPPLMTIHGERDMVIVDFKTTSMTADTAFKGRGGFVINCNHGGGHCGGAALAPSIWTFFKAHPYGVDPNPWTMLPAGFHQSCMIF